MHSKYPIGSPYHIIFQDPIFRISSATKRIPRSKKKKQTNRNHSGKNRSKIIPGHKHCRRYHRISCYSNGLLSHQSSTTCSLSLSNLTKPCLCNSSASNKSGSEKSRLTKMPAPSTVRCVQNRWQKRKISRYSAL